MGDILTRSITGAIFVGVIIFSIYFSPFAALFVFSAFLLLGLVEFFKLFKENKIVELRWGTPVVVSFITYLLLLGNVFLGWDMGLIISIIIPTFLLLMMTELWRKKSNPLVNLGIQLFGFFYLVIPFLLLMMMQQLEIHSCS